MTRRQGNRRHQREPGHRPRGGCAALVEGNSTTFGKTASLMQLPASGQLRAVCCPPAVKGATPSSCRRAGGVPETLVIITKSGGVGRNQGPHGPGAPWSPGKMSKAARDATSGPAARCGASYAAVAAAGSLPHCCDPASVSHRPPDHPRWPGGPPRQARPPKARSPGMDWCARHNPATA